MDTFGSIDAYIRCDFLRQKIKTKWVTQKSGELEWNQEIWIPAQMPMASDRITMKLYDYDKVSDEIVGSMVFRMKNYIERGQSGNFFWENIYGSPLGVMGDVTDRMNLNPEIASFWKGRILMQVTAEKTDKPEMKVIDVDPDARREAQRYMGNREYIVLAEASQGICLPSDDKYKLKIRIGDLELTSDKPRFNKKGYCFWNHRFKETRYTCPYQSVDEMEHFYVYLCDGDKHICYFKGEVADFTDPNPIHHWVALTNDLSVGNVKESYKAGMVSFKLTIHDATANGPLNTKEIPAWASKLPDRPQAFMARCYIYQCKNLPSADKDGTSDPYI